MDSETIPSDILPASRTKFHHGTSFNLSFTDLSYSVGKGNKTKKVLHNISGTFKSGQLTAILGPSGAGKTSLMNILAGLKKSGIEGQIFVNGAQREFETFRKESAYVTQKDHLLTNLTVDEYFIAAAHLKLGNNVSNKEKISTIKDILKTLGLTGSQYKRVSCLSGGERKRLSIGLELIDNPSILFLDEPTSGLDSSSSLQCVALLRKIARSGRTVVATIHQPSSRLLSHFDHLYLVASGSCIYQGPVGSLVSYLKVMDLNCPSYHNPADFALDVASGEYGEVLEKLISGIENGRNSYHDGSGSTSSASPRNSHDAGVSEEDEEQVTMLEGLPKTKKAYRVLDAVPFYMQVKVLLGRTWKTIWREKILTAMRLALHVVVAMLVGLLYWQIGDDAAVIFNNVGLVFFNMLFIMAAAMMPTVLTFTLDMEVLIREHLNQWYSLKAYYLAKTLADIPFQIIFPIVYLVPVYFMTNQPMSLERFGLLLVIMIWMSLVGQGLGLFFGATFDIQSASFLAATSTVPIFLLSGFFVTFDAIPSPLRWLTYFSFARYGFEGSMLSIYAYDRAPLACSDSYCHFRFPQKFLEQFDLTQSSYSWSIVGLMVNYILVRMAGYLALLFKLRHVR
ncbi:ATP-binding cassette sub-family G member 1-like [Daphnia carinata]|uniref:ATP-binding cassette sub-family G member 1-like n=1 Tax=Daphnia carinata TaxID=120202 RepID=UPI00257DF0E2|nr:ATP-binding cassette sub-family G member 1-like [Daphnia carinata]XP_057380715.1 ATP-binding cassette sub-family G member 1-like [Daphnia carinata]